MREYDYLLLLMVRKMGMKGLVKLLNGYFYILCLELDKMYE